MGLEDATGPGHAGRWCCAADTCAGAPREWGPERGWLCSAGTRQRPLRCDIRNRRVLQTRTAPRAPGAQQQRLCRETLGALSQGAAEAPSAAAAPAPPRAAAITGIIPSWAHISLGLDTNLFTASSPEC